MAMYSIRALSKWRSALVCPLCLAVGIAGELCATAAASDEPKPDRVVHSFDFDERDEGNLEDLPKFWMPVRPSGFPQFAQGGFDFNAGRTAPPSFHLVSEGRNVAYQYMGPDTRVRPNSEYRIEGFIRPDRLTHARACLSAHFQDRQGRTLVGTLVRSRHIGGPSEPAGWAKVELFLPAAPAQADTVGLVAWVLQEPTWNTTVPARRHIPMIDVHGGAWFDDITLHALPRAQITTSAPGNVLPPNTPQMLEVILTDNRERGIAGRVEITSAEGTPVETHQVPAVTFGPVTPSRIPLDHLQPGLYTAQLDVFTDSALVLSRGVTFAKLAPRYNDRGGTARPFGVVIEPESRSDPTTEFDLLRHQVARSAKLPVWTGLVAAPATPAERRAGDRLLQALVKEGFALTGVFFGPPSAIVWADGPFPRPLIEVLAGPPSAWQEHLAAVAAPYAAVFHWWQLGRDGHASKASVDDKILAVNQLSDALRPFMTTSQLVLPVEVAVEPDTEKYPVQQIALAIGHETPADWTRTQVEKFVALGYGTTSAFVEPLPDTLYRQLPRIADWAQRIITARHAGADIIFTPATWRVRETSQGKVTEPLEQYLILRTIADVISDAVPGQRISLAPSIRCLAFHDGDSTVLAMWDSQAPPEGSRAAIQLGRATRQIDLWGRSTPLERDDRGRQVVRLSAVPVLVDGVDRWLIDLRTSVSLSPGHVESGTELITHTLSMANRGTRAIPGLVALGLPASWDAVPRASGFTLMPDRDVHLKVAIHYPHNEPAGNRSVVAQINLTDDSYYLEVPLPIQVGLTDIEVSGMATIEGRDLILRHAVTNRSSEVLHFRGAADVPGRERQYRPFAGLYPGASQTVEYRFLDAADLAGVEVRLGLREMNDGPRTHTLELVAR